MNHNQQCSAAELERMMKLQDVLLKAMAGKLHWWEAAEIMGVTHRTARRWRDWLEKYGYDGLADRRIGKRSPASGGEDVRRSAAKKGAPDEFPSNAAGVLLCSKHSAG